MLASYSSSPRNSKGRLFPEKEDVHRDCYQRDRDRIIHSSVFRRLMHKTQVFTCHGNEYYRSRLTHSLEVSQIARSIARLVNVNEDLTETIALAHDIGHPPFGHIGEEALLEVISEHYKFDHNAQTIRILTELERQYMEFNGLNLTWETIEGIAKHNGPIKDPHQIIREYNELVSLDLQNYSSLEAQISAIADDIAYSSHDIDDGLSSKLITYQDLKDLPIIGENITRFEKVFPNTDESRIIYKAIRKMIGFLINDVVAVIRKNIECNSIKTAEDIRNAGVSVAHFSPKVEQDIKKIKAFLYKNLYFHYRVNKNRSRLKRIVKDLFEILFEDPQCLPDHWYERVKKSSSTNRKAQVICDFISALTDRSAMREHQRFFSTYVFDSDY
ncbi:dGTPase family protein [Neorickettsia helminthoeca str. Oregon]|uniref:Deoxyguanosinetriphosphate triphosphohydrolase-like protein n=1 Tax=Neorickettsia helminthoeca str. Oregon TaxID=1286528 RepID=X5H484_9RICK|nr:deoxyguanosinetriphosphate triphosphohydrolase [Neorickettsia helminthoeca]AHX11376.1 dGTPase family protein [Neorickettsia helminthoeca str. Oregon]